MTRDPTITAGDFVDGVMAAFPATIAVFLRRRMSCVGCLMGPFHTVADAAHEYGLDVDQLLAELRQAAARPIPLRQCAPRRADF
jgi:hybrid cluster-associated redox disulfide protein